MGMLGKATWLGIFSLSLTVSTYWSLSVLKYNQSLSYPNGTYIYQQYHPTL